MLCNRPDAVFHDQIWKKSMNIPKEIKTKIESEFKNKSGLWSPNFKEFDRFFTSTVAIVAGLVMFVGSLPFNAPNPGVHFSLLWCLAGLGSIGFGIVDTCRHSIEHMHRYPKESWPEIHATDRGILQYLLYPFAYLRFIAKQNKFVAQKSQELVNGKCLDIVPGSEDVVWDCLLQKTKLENIRDQVNTNIEKSAVSIQKLKDMPAESLSNHPMTAIVQQKLSMQLEELQAVKEKTTEQIIGINAQLGNMESKVRTISDYKTIVESALLVESNDFIINEAKIIFEGFHNELTARNDSILELESDMKVLGKTINEVPQVVLALNLPG